ncbi:STAS domain-containing protein [Streptomyces erythrochromogenes]|uniref:STAS domain-containing protein n=1 Tax=Streptomyces erythrochromogenes TaxID=285574 RepID=UPI00225303D7|nr:STAS domain-containing protein [Streptomyces erythrochromogenes]MCX5583293.1 STAS domain-containing protein [Streptomyces erythrochromogenes]
MSALTITIREAGPGPVLEIAGDLDYDQAPRLRQAVTTLSLGPGQRLVLDLSRIRFCDSSGITALIVARNHAVAAQADIVLAAVPDNTIRILRIVGLDRVFTIHPDLDSATGHRPTT